MRLFEANMFSNYLSCSFWKLLLSVCTFLIKRPVWMKARTGRACAPASAALFISSSGFMLNINCVIKATRLVAEITSLFIKQARLLPLPHRRGCKSASDEVLLKDTPEGHSLQAPSAELENGSSQMRLGSLYDRLFEAENKTFILITFWAERKWKSLVLWWKPDIYEEERGTDLEPEAKGPSDFYMKSVRENLN